MKKMYTLALAFALFTSGIFAQSNTDVLNKNDKGAAQTIKSPKLANEFNKDAQAELWSDDFSDPNTWVIEHDATACSLDWEIGTGLSCGGFAPINNINSTTSENGFAMVDSDEYGGETGGSEVEDSWFTTANSIDLSANPNVILEFQSFYRKWTYEECYVVISTNNTDWPELDPDYDAESNPNVFRVWPGMGTQDPVLNPTIKRLDISAAAGNQATVWIRFHWTGTWGYAWFVDDVRVLEQAANDMTMEYGVISHNGTGDEYGRVPADQLNPQINLGALTTNFGYDAQTDIIIDILIEDESSNEILSTSSDVEPALAPTDTLTFSTDEDLPALATGMYTTTFTVTSAEEQDGDQFFNNVVVRNFEITDDLYSLDGIGVDPVSNIGSLGTNSFTDAEDGFFMMTLYDFNQSENIVYGIEVLLGSTTVPGGSVIAHLMDTVDVYGNNIDQPIVSSDEIEITQDHVDAGIVRIYFESGENLSAGSYMAAIEMFSNGSANDIRIINDVTTPQPPWSSVIFIPNDQTYTNPNAAAIRVLMSPASSVYEITKDASLGQNIPNPAVNRTTIGFELLSAQNVSIVITDILGKVVLEEKLGNLAPGTYSRVIELNGLNAGTYHYSIVTENGSLTKAMQVIR